MNTTFPFGLEPPVAFYMTLSMLTLVLHVIFMAYVLAGSLYIAWATVFSGNGHIARTRRPVAALLREWMPFMLSGAITAAVAPLLFIQVIYRQQFYASNLLLGWRWLMVIPVLIVAFYLLYLLKSRAVANWSVMARCSLAMGVAGSLVFVAFCWTTNHLLSIQSETWAHVWETGDVVASAAQLSLRLLMWIAGVFPVMSVLVAWQLWGTADSAEAAIDPSAGQSRSLSRMSLIALVVSGLSGFAYVCLLPDAVQRNLIGPAGRAWLLTAAVGLVIQGSGWVRYWNPLRVPTVTLSVIALGTLTTITATACLREIVRVTQSDLTLVEVNCRAAATIGGFGLFLAGLLLNLLLIGWCLKLVSSSLKDKRIAE